MTSRKLSLQKEHLVELTSGELEGVVGGSHVTCTPTEGCTHGNTFERCEVQTLPVNVCFDTRYVC